jgi:signal peptidase II
MTSRLQRLLVLFTIVVACVGCDQALKQVAADRLVDSEVISVLGGLVQLQPVGNPGAFLSLGATLAPGIRLLLFTLIVPAMLVVLIIHVLRGRGPVGDVIAAALIIGGGAGNLVDRLWLGVVRDFASIGLGPFRTGIFNIADVCITVGVLAVAARLWSARARRRPRTECE